MEGHPDEHVRHRPTGSRQVRDPLGGFAEEEERMGAGRCPYGSSEPAKEGIRYLANQVSI